MSTAIKPKQRKCFTDRERQRLRLCHTTYLNLTPHQLASWFENEFGRRVSSSSIYDILSPKYAYLDTTEATDAVRKKKGPQRPELEEELYKWWDEARHRDVNGKELRKKANDIWQTLPACHQEKAPSFSDGWLSNWRTRYGISQHTKAADVNRSSLEAERIENAQDISSLNLLCALQRPPSPQCIDLAVWNGSSRLTLPLEEVYHDLPLKIPYPECQTVCNPVSVWGIPSTTHFCSSVIPSHWSRPDFKACELQAEDRLVGREQKAKTLELITSQNSIATRTQRCTTHSGLYNRIDPSDQAIWTGIRRLFLECNSRSERDLITTNTAVLSVLEPFLSSLEFDFQDCSEIIHWRQRKAKKAIGLIYAAKEFRLRHAEDRLQQVFYEDWFLDFIDVRVLQRASPDPAAIEDSPSPRFSSSSDPIFKQQRTLRSKTSSFSPITKNGTVDIWTQTFAATEEYAVEKFQATAVITPPTGVHSVPQTIIQLATRTTEFTSSISMPIISFRPIIPECSAIFNIAEYGTSSDLQMMLSRRENSVSDCDPTGRSLINYALDGRNASTLKYLLTKVKDIDVYEPDSSGIPSSLIGMLMGFDGDTCHYERDRRWTCLKLMLAAGADPYLNYYPSLESSTFESELHYGTVIVLNALLDQGHPCVHANAAFSITFNSEYEQTPLLSLAEHYRYLFHQSLHMSEKTFLLLDRGADITTRDLDGKTCLHYVLMCDADMGKEEFRAYDESEFKDILMCMVTAGADLAACDVYGKTISQTAIEYGHEGLWREVIALCGYNPDEVFSIEHDFCHNDFQKQPGMGVFTSATPNVRLAKLSFEEYRQQRKSLSCVRKAYSRQEVDVQAELNEAFDFWETYIETSDSEDYEWVNVPHNHPRIKHKKAQRKKRGFKLTIPNGCPKLLHDGVLWKIAFGC